MASQPFISVCIPTYKNVAYTERLLQSIAIQTYTDFEIVITDNSPDDSIATLAQAFSDRLSIRYHKNDPPTEMAENFNRGLAKARGKWIKMMHDDDWFSGAGSLAAFAEAAMKTRSKFIFSAYREVYSPSGKTKEETLTGWRKEMLEQDPLNLFFLNVIGHPSVLMHINDPQLVYDIHYRWVVDVDFYMRFLHKHPGFEYLADPLVNIGIDEAQMSNKYYKNPHVEIPEYLSMLSKYPPDLSLKNEYVFHMLWNLVKKFRIRHIDQVREAGYPGTLPAGELQAIIDYQQRIPRLIIKQTPWSKALMKRCFLKINR